MLKTESASWHGLLEKPPTQQYNGIDWLFTHSRSQEIQWLNKIQLYLTHLENRSESSQKQKTPYKKTQERLRIISDFNSQQILNIRALLPDFKWDQQKKMLTEIAQNRIPTQQHIESYITNIFRDWVWGQAENEVSAKFVAQMLPQKNLTGLNVVYLGAGACRLPYDLHLQMQPQNTICVDINPLLLSVPKKILEGQTVQLIEFPLPAKKHTDVAIAHQISWPEKKPHNFHFLFSEVRAQPEQIH